MDQMKKDLPEDVILDVAFDNTMFIRASISEVQNTVIIAFILVVLIIFAFLRNWRVTLIPAVVIPISLIGIFFVMYLAGFSINVLSMLAVVLAVGLVVDDAIVVTENIFQKVEAGMNPQEAAIAGSKEIFFAVISTTITLVAIFFPIVFLEGMTGRLFREFSIVISGAVIISSFVALSFVPMLSSKLLKKKQKHNPLYDKTEVFFVGMNRFYDRMLRTFLHRKWLVLPILILSTLLIILFWNIVPAEMAPLEDRSQIMIRSSAPEGATFEYVRDFTDRISEIADSIAPERESNIVFTRSGFSMVRMVLPDMNERERSQMEIAGELSAAIRNENAARAFVQQQSTFGGRRAGMPIQYVLQAPNIEKLQEFIPPIMERVSNSPYFPDGRRGPQVHQAGDPHPDRPRQGSDAGGEYPRHRPDPAVCTQRTTNGLLLHEWQAISDPGGDQPPTTQYTDRPEDHLYQEQCGRDDPDGQPGETGRVGGTPSVISLQLLQLGNHLRGIGSRLPHWVKGWKRWTVSWLMYWTTASAPHWKGNQETSGRVPPACSSPSDWPSC